MPHDSRGGISKGFAQALAGWARLDTKSLKSGNVFEYFELCLLKIFSNIQSLPESQLVRLAGDVREDLPVQLGCFRSPYLFVNASKIDPTFVKGKKTIKQRLQDESTATEGEKLRMQAAATRKASGGAIGGNLRNQKM